MRVHWELKADHGNNSLFFSMPIKRATRRELTLMYVTLIVQRTGMPRSVALNLLNSAFDGTTEREQEEVTQYLLAKCLDPHRVRAGARLMRLA